MRGPPPPPTKIHTSKLPYIHQTHSLSPTAGLVCATQTHLTSLKCQRNWQRSCQTRICQSARPLTRLPSMAGSADSLWECAVPQSCMEKMSRRSASSCTESQNGVRVSGWWSGKQTVQMHWTVLTTVSVLNKWTFWDNPADRAQDNALLCILPCVNTKYILWQSYSLGAVSKGKDLGRVPFSFLGPTVS